MEYRVSEDGRILMSKADLKKHGLVQDRKRPHIQEEGWEPCSSSDEEEDLEVDKDIIKSLMLIRPSKNLQRLLQKLEGIPGPSVAAPRSQGPLPTPTGLPTSYGISEDPGRTPPRPSQRPEKEKQEKQERTYTETEVQDIVRKAVQAELRGQTEKGSRTTSTTDSRRAASNQAKYTAERVPPPPYPDSMPNIPPVAQPRDIPAVKAKPRAAPKTACLPRRTSILPAFTRLRRAELEVLAQKWGLDPMGLTMAQIHDRLFELDRRLADNSAGSR